jgi:AraC-like DNA-binding protein
MPIKFARCGFQGQVSSLPNRFIGLSEDAYLRGIGFIEYRYRDSGTATHSVAGILICACECGPECIFSYNFAANATGLRDTFVLRGPEPDVTASWTGGHRGRLLSIAPHVLERIYRKPLSQIHIEPAFGDLRDRTQVLYLLASLADEHSGKRRVDPLFVESVALAVLRASGITQWERVRKSPALSAAQIGIVRNLIHANLTGALTLREMASAVDLSESYFVRAFKGSFGETPYRYVLRERVALAQTLIQDSKLPLSEIALPAGFPDANRMGRTFRRITGHSPTGATKSRRRARPS